MSQAQATATSVLVDLDARKAYDDLWRRTLSKIPGDLNRLVYLATMRDYNSGRYHHAGLETSFGFVAAGQALEAAHREVFWKLAQASLEQLVEELELYVRNSGESTEELLAAWRGLQPYRIALPLSIDPLAAHLLLSNLKLGLEVLHSRRCPPSPHP
ncbi:MAG TPA: hypothetical protein VMH31_10255 [Methylomirabilota bacterium]|nr:hypothetical protein [Methylomirabilota bacterium]